MVLDSDMHNSGKSCNILFQQQEPGETWSMKTFMFPLESHFQEITYNNPHMKGCGHGGAGLDPVWLSSRCLFDLKPLARHTTDWALVFI